MRKCRPAVLATSVIIVLLWLVAAASATGIVYWSPYGGTISYAALDGSGAGQLNTGSASVAEPDGIGLDPITGRIYWANSSGGSSGSFAWADLNNSGTAGNLTISGTATVDFPVGVAVDPVAGRIYWANANDESIAYANLDGSDSANLSTPGVTPEGPTGVAVDPAQGRIYWGNTDSNPNSISWAALNGSGGGTLNTGSAPVSGPGGLAIDPDNGRIYWANSNSPSTIGWASLSGTGGGTLDTSGTTPQNPIGVAIDPATGRIYWANATGPSPISSASVNGGGGANLPTPGVTGDENAFPALLYPPKTTHRPKLSGAKRQGSKLKCTRGAWAPDIVESFFYQSPQSYAYAWKRNGHTIKSAIKPSYKARKAGHYACTVTATNAAGSTAQTSTKHTVKRRHRR